MPKAMNNIQRYIFISEEGERVIFFLYGFLMHLLLPLSLWFWSKRITTVFLLPDGIIFYFFLLDEESFGAFCFLSLLFFRTKTFVTYIYYTLFPYIFRLDEKSQSLALFLSLSLGVYSFSCYLLLQHFSCSFFRYCCCLRRIFSKPHIIISFWRIQQLTTRNIILLTTTIIIFFAIHLKLIPSNNILFKCVNLRKWQ